MGRHRDLWRSALPPRKKDWVAGHTQIGVFYRGPAGEVIEFVIHKATQAQQRAIAAFFRALPTVEEALIKAREDNTDGENPVSIPATAEAQEGSEVREVREDHAEAFSQGWAEGWAKGRRF